MRQSTKAGSAGAGPDVGGWLAVMVALSARIIRVIIDPHSPNIDAVCFNHNCQPLMDKDG